MSSIKPYALSSLYIILFIIVLHEFSLIKKVIIIIVVLYEL